MGWTERSASGERRTWERDDGHASVVLRETSTGEWAVTLDRLEQAPEGSAYERVIVATREQALDVADGWRQQYDI